MNKEDLKEIVKEFLSPYIDAMVDYKKLCDEKDKEIEKLKQLLEDEELCKEIAQGHRKEVQEREARESKEIKRLNNIINELNNAYCKVITKCEEMKNNRWYMNVNAIKKYAGEIIDICKYYVGEAKDLKGDSSNE